MRSVWFLHLRILPYGIPRRNWNCRSTRYFKARSNWIIGQFLPLKTSPALNIEYIADIELIKLFKIKILFNFFVSSLMPESQIHLIDTATTQSFPAAPTGTVLSSSIDLGWQGITVELHSLPASEYPEHYVQGHRLAIMRRGKPIIYEWKDNGKWQSRHTHQGTFFLQSHGDINYPRWFETFEIIAISLEPSFVARCFQDTINSDLLHFQECRAKYDLHLAKFAAYFEAELLNNNYGGTLYGESLALAFSLYLLERYSDRFLPLPRPKGKLSSLQLKEVIEYIHAHLGSELSLTELATQLNLSTFHFARLFKKSLGLSPHKYVLQNRLERAKRLIAVASQVSLSDIALQVGFYDQTHFSKAFKKYVGVSPKAFSKLSA